MTVVFVHGVPETSAVWDGVRALLTEESVALALPGFGVPRPAGFSATKDAYADWLAGALERIEGPIDLVGHDWGALLTLRVATAFTAPLRSWTVDVANNFHPASRWHPAAQIWQTPDVGEQRMRAAREAAPDDPDSFTARLIHNGVPTEQAHRMGAAHDETMSGCILDLYRSAMPNVYADWGAQATTATRAPGLVLLLPDDAEDEAMSLDVARWLGARTDRLDGLDHCWMAQDPQAAVTVLRRLWRSLGDI
jgi:pimeloyl-ACP methyl ester carboxylesterase